jgi:type III pantothenate kinase
MNALLIDIGNTRIKWCTVETRRTDALDHEDSFDRAWRGDGGALALAEVDQLAAHWRSSVGDPVDVAWLSNVASVGLGATVERTLRATWPGVRVERVTACAARGGIVNGYADPQVLGPDRWLGLIGGHHLAPDRSLLVCSFGTATTIDLLVVPDGARGGPGTFVGGLILPGVDAMRRVLVERTARLPDRPGRLVEFADNTDDAITSGVLCAQLGAVERAWRDADRRVAANGRMLCLVAGGSAAMFAPSLDAAGIPLRVVPDLVLRGLAVVAREADRSERTARASDRLQ